MRRSVNSRHPTRNTTRVPHFATFLFRNQQATHWKKSEKSIKTAARRRVPEDPHDYPSLSPDYS
jgi:hypothetical protein